MIGERIKSLRKKKGFSQIELASMLGVGQPRISEFEQNRRKPRKEAILAMSKIFGVPTGEIDPTAKQTFLGR